VVDKTAFCTTETAYGHPPTRTTILYAKYKLILLHNNLTNRVFFGWLNIIQMFEKFTVMEATGLAS
jgi:hypothetical protein